MYYLLGYRIIKECEEVVLKKVQDQEKKTDNWGDEINTTTGITGKSKIFRMLDEEVLYKVSILLTKHNLALYNNKIKTVFVGHIGHIIAL